MADATILTVVILDHFEMIKANLDLIFRQNAGVSLDIVIVDNSESPGIFDRFNSVDNVRVIPGVPKDSERNINCRGSYQHAAALMHGMQFVESEFVVVLDPDFFVLRFNWIRDVIKFMKEARLVFFGAPWHPRWFTKCGGFPCVHFLAIDLSLVDRQQLDFSPGIEEYPHWSQYVFPDRDSIGTIKPRYYSSTDRVIPFWQLKLACFVQRFCKKFRLESFITKRFLLDSSKDTGYRLWKVFYKDRNSSEAFEFLQPMTDLARDFKWHPFVSRFDNVPGLRQIEGLLPSNWSFLSRFSGVLDRMDCPFVNFKVAAKMGVELFGWQGTLFGAHFRSNLHRVHLGTVFGGDVIAALSRIDSALKYERISATRD